MNGSTLVRIAAAADLHTRVDSPRRIARLLGPVSGEADVLALCGDLTDHGLPEEAAVLADDLSAIGIPKVAVLGNHDFEAGKASDVCRILGHAGVHILQGDTWIFDKRLGFAGVKGFGGGFGDSMLQAWGEEMWKKLVYESIEESMKLEMALAKLDGFGIHTKVALMHYSPVHSTIEGERPEIAPFLGCSRFADSIDKQGVAAAFHGHAHSGSLVGRTAAGVPVYNVAMPLLRTAGDKRYVVVTVDAPRSTASPSLSATASLAGAESHR